MTYQPLNDSVLVQPEPDPTYAEYTGTALVVPEAYKWGPIDSAKWGKVLAKGPACRDAAVKVGDRVLYGKFGWARLPIDKDSHYAIVREQDLLAVEC